MAEQLEVTGAEAGVGVSFARAKVRQLRALGLTNVSKTFKFLGFTVLVRINGPDEYIWVQAGRTVAFHVSPNYEPRTPPDDSKGDNCVITTLTGDTVAANKEEFYERSKQKAGTHYWVSQDGKRILSWDGTKKLRVHHPESLYEAPSIGGGDRIYVNGVERRTTHPVTAAAMFDGRVVYLSTSSELAGHLVAGGFEIRLEGGFEIGEADKLVRRFDIPAATERVVSGYSPHPLGGNGGVTFTEFPVQVTGMAEFSPDGRKAFMVCQTFGPEALEGVPPWHVYAPVRVFEVSLSIVDGEVVTSGGFTASLGADPEYTADREYSLTPGTTDPTEAYWVRSEMSRTTEVKKLTEFIGASYVKVRDTYLPAAILAERSHRSEADYLYEAEEGPGNDGGGFYMPIRQRATTTTTSSASITFNGVDLLRFPPWTCRESSSSDYVVDFPSNALVSGEFHAEIETESKVVEIRSIDQRSGSLVVAIYTDRKTGASSSTFADGEQTTSGSSMDMHGSVGFHLVRGGEFSYSNVRTGGIPPGGVYSGGLNRVFLEDAFRFIRYIDRSSSTGLGQPDVLASTEGVVMAYINTECALGVSSLDYISGSPNSIMNRVFALTPPLPEDGRGEGVLVVSRRKPLPGGSVKDLTTATEIAAYATKDFHPVTLGVRPPKTERTSP